MNTIYTVGYADWTPTQLAAKAEGLDALLVDIRFNPTSRNAGWRQGPLIKRFGVRYVYVHALGNEQYQRGKGVRLHDVEEGVRLVGQLLREQPVILMCVCSNIETCRRKAAAEVLSERLGAPIIHLTPPPHDSD